ncbi:hypothetical protein AVEN_107651-1 [Araneus ventricosus]|uniref:Uncharacterized protein n=1 Tax=Araneus ventricosus TaxID=182803 RepID=A0A4Y2PFI7_ARAVE|nr:hypothetical protein AVEN_107651-1 [Araneus ventricosus]
MLTGEHLWVQHSFEDKPICLSLAEMELEGKFGQIKTKAAVVCSQVDRGRYLLGNRTTALLGKDIKCLIFPKVNALQTGVRSEWLSRKRKQASCEISFPKEPKLKNEESHFLHSEVISEEKGNEALDTILQANCQESGNKVLSIKTEPDVDQEFLEDADFGSVPEQENERSFREVGNRIIEKAELISDDKIPVSANRLNDSAQKKPNIDSSETEISYKSHFSSVNRGNDESQIEMRIEKDDMAELMQLQKENLYQVNTVPHSLVNDVEALY